VKRISEEATLKKVSKNSPEEKMSVGKPRNRWFDEAENDLKKIGVRERVVNNS
jgi:hypothetical protein